MLNTVDEVIEALGGPTATASLAGVGVSAVSNWSFRGRIAPDKFVIISDALASLGKEVRPTVFGFKFTDEVRA